ncbi:MAG: helicase-exonuclease AddAB subunit AddA [Oscillospiraceae bacterium]|jgi:ATP-dependent helicase/nuclease subunit A|nr:helicase-exonuclease AddAB subunit AddA [Oscillospiraceae bacterium]MCI2192313.1 helicase-exonuclease AddAB subunit AddA [Oscillospiraceae bacterium]MCI2205171.1 helicase-exonuclease AddAB subunit AddA [Oscillospiraceae bacterium]
MEREWTSAQKDAIEARGGPLLVSAAAGSGKTAVLVERVIKRITDPKDPIDADRLLVVTYTKAAAAEMRGRIADKLSELLEEEPDSLFLQRQQLLLSRAHISTVHSFCQELLREHFSAVGISPDFRIADESELSVLQNETLDMILNLFYEKNDPVFYQLLDAFSAGRDDHLLRNILFKLYDFVRSHPFPSRWLREKAAMYDCQNIRQSVWGDVITQFAQQTFSYAISITQHSTRLLESADEKLRAASMPAFLSDREMLEALLKSLQNDSWDDFSQKIQMASFERLSTPRGYSDDSIKIAVAENRKEVKSGIEDLKAIFAPSEAECLEDLQQLKPLVEKLFAILEEFHTALQQKKAERKMADFGDLEHWALQLLVEETPEGYQKTSAAEEISNQFDEIMVDEYQDTNETQDLLFRAVSKDETNLFMVGDVKQSIYSFRQAMPELFLRRREKSAEYHRDHAQFPACITLDRNFRSHFGITESVNFFFRQLMSREVGQMEYTEKESLVCGAEYPERKDPALELDVLQYSAEETDHFLEAECRRIAEKIFEWTATNSVTENGQMRPAQYREICILLRSANQYAPVYADELGKLGIPAWADAGKGFFDAPEVRAVLSLLQTIDNPLNDLSLLALLMGPIGGFSLDEMADIRAKSKDSSLFASLQKAAAEGNKRILSFLKQLSLWRNFAAALPSDQLIGALYEETGYADIVLAMENGTQRLANLRLLQERARSYEDSGHNGLSGFLRFLERLKNQGQDIPMAETLSESANVVRIMSIHKSKGLEFPIVILAGCSRKFHTEKDTVLLHPQMGLGIQLRAAGKEYRVKTLPWQANAILLRQEGMSEELRVFYVALTRAKEKLLLLCSEKDPEKTLSSLACKMGEKNQIPPFAVQHADCLSDWILLCALRHPDSKKLRELSSMDCKVLPCDASWKVELIHDQPFEPEQNEACKIEMPPADPKLLEELMRYTQYQYPYRDLGAVRAKTAASELAEKPFQKQYAAMSRPAFLGKKGLTPAERGTALHAFLQFADWKILKENAQGELERLIKEGFLTSEQANAVDLSAVMGFCQTSVFDRIQRSPRVLREYRFSVEIPAKRLDQKLTGSMAQEPVVLQGAIDCAFEENNGIILMDYKTDHVQSAEELWNRYQGQLLLYREALEKCLGLPVTECLLYSFALHKEIRETTN